MAVPSTLIKRCFGFLREAQTCTVATSPSSSKSSFMDLLENFILFDDSSGEPKKILARNHQFLGVNRAIGAVRERKTRHGKLGVFWHTQGAGKSYSMVMFTRKVHRKLGGNFTFVVLTDRDDLDTQIYKTFAEQGIEMVPGAASALVSSGAAIPCTERMRQIGPASRRAGASQSR